MISMAFVCLLLNSIVLVIGLGASLFVHVLILDGNAQSFLRNLVQFSQPSDFVVSGIKAVAFALISGIVACYKGLTVKRGAQGVGDAVNETVVLSFVLVFVANLAITQFYPLFRSEEHTSELQSLMRISYAVFCLKKKNDIKQKS